MHSKSLLSQGFCQSVTIRYYSKTAQHIVKILSPSDNPFILVLYEPNQPTKSRWNHPQWGSKYRLGMRNSWVSSSTNERDRAKVSTEY